MLSKSYQMVFEECFKNNIKEQMISHISGDGGLPLASRIIQSLDQGMKS